MNINAINGSKHPKTFAYMVTEDYLPRNIRQEKPKKIVRKVEPISETLGKNVDVYA